MQRRDFLRGAALGAGVAATAGNPGRALGAEGARNARVSDPTVLPLITDPGERRDDMLHRPFGHSNQAISAIGLGCLELGTAALTDAEAIRLIHEAIDHGVTFLDTGWDQNDGRSQLRVGLALGQGRYRDKVFLASKIDGRTMSEATSQIETSLKRLRTDHLDLVLHHEILRFDDPDRVFAVGGAMEAFAAARLGGTAGAIGFSGHKDPRIHLQMLDVAAEHGVRFDAVQMPLNVLDAHFRSFARAVLPRLVREGIAVLGTHPFGDGTLRGDGAQVLASEALRYALTLPTSAVITEVRGQRDLDQVLQAVRTFEPMDREGVVELLSRSRPCAVDGRHERFKTTALFDGTARNPRWLGDDAIGEV